VKINVSGDGFQKIQQ